MAHTTTETYTELERELMKKVEELTLDVQELERQLEVSYKLHLKLGGQ
ncbi:hypothetical protein [Sutcliffiella cohnii]|nr:hypothetical protein [Sutcliffiella cohnii]